MMWFKFNKDCGNNLTPTGVTVSDTSLLRHEQKVTRLYERSQSGAPKKRIWAYRLQWLVWAGVFAPGAVAAFSLSTPFYGHDAAVTSNETATRPCVTPTGVTVLNCHADVRYGHIRGRIPLAINIPFEAKVCSTFSFPNYDQGLTELSWSGVVGTGGSSQLRHLVFEAGGQSVARNRSVNSLATTPTVCLRADTSIYDSRTPDPDTYHMTIFPPVLVEVVDGEHEPISPHLLPDAPIEATCTGDETWAECYEKAKTAYNDATCNTPVTTMIARTAQKSITDGGCGNLTLTATEMLKKWPLQDSDATLTSATVVTEPVDLPTTANAVSKAVNVFDFTIKDGGTEDQQSTDITQITVNTSGTGDFSKVTWRLSGDDASNVTGTYSSADNTLTFSSLSISVADKQSETYTLNAYYKDNTGITDNSTYILSVDGNDLTLDSKKTQMGKTTAVTNGTGSKATVTATKLTFVTQPSPTSLTVGSAFDFTTDPIVNGVDAANNLDKDFTGTVELSENGAGTGTFINESKTASSGVATFTGLTLSHDKAETIKLLAKSTDLTDGQSNDLTVNKADQTDFDATADPTSIVIGGTATLSISEGQSRGGDGDIDVATNANCSYGKGSIITAISAGDCNITVTQEGDDSYKPATKTVTVKITKIDQTGFKISEPDTMPVNITNILEVTGGQGAGTVNFELEAGLCKLISTTGGMAVQSDTVGSICKVKATKAGDDTYNSTSATESITVVKADQTITFTAPTDKTFGDDAFGVTAASDSGLDVSISSATPTVCTIDTTTNKVTLLTAGDCTLKAEQAGDDNYKAATAVTKTITGDKADQTITFTPPTDKTFGDDAFDVTAASNSNLDVSISSTTTAVCTIDTATNKVTLLTAGDCTLKAEQAGNDDYNAADAVSKTIKVAKAEQTITFTDPGDQTFVADASFDVIVSSDSGLDIMLISNNIGVCTVSGKQITIKSAGTCKLQASQAGNHSYKAAVGKVLEINISANDTAGITVSKTSVSVAETGTTDTFTVVLNTQPTANVTIDVSSNDVSEGTVTPTTLTFTNTNWNTAQTVTITSVDDDEVDGDQTFKVLLAAANSTDSNYSSKDPVDVTAINIDLGKDIPPGAEDTDPLTDSTEQGPDGTQTTYDGNGDNTADKLQSNVLSMPVNSGKNYATFVLEQAFNDKTKVEVISNPSSSDVPEGVTFPLGFIDIDVPANAGAAKVVMYIPPGVEMPTSYYKHTRTKANTTAHWYEFLYDGTTGAEINAAARTITLHFKDSERGDDDMDVNGHIDDQGGPVVVSGGSTATGTGNINPQNIPVFGPFGLLASLLGLFWLGRRRKTT